MINYKRNIFVIFWHFLKRIIRRDYVIVSASEMSYQSVQKFTYEVIGKSARWRYACI